MSALRLLPDRAVEWLAAHAPWRSVRAAAVDEMWRRWTAWPETEQRAWSIRNRTRFAVPVRYGWLTREQRADLERARVRRAQGVPAMTIEEWRAQRARKDGAA